MYNYCIKQFAYKNNFAGKLPGHKVIFYKIFLEPNDLQKVLICKAITQIAKTLNKYFFQIEGLWMIEWTRRFITEPQQVNFNIVFNSFF